MVVFFAIIFAAVALFCTALFALMFLGNIFAVMIVMVPILVVGLCFFLYCYVASEVYIQEDTLYYTFGPFVYKKQTIENICMIISKNDTEFRNVEIVDKQRKTTYISTSIKDATKLLDKIGEAAIRKNVDISWLEV